MYACLLESFHKDQINICELNLRTGSVRFVDKIRKDDAKEQLICTTDIATSLMNAPIRAERNDTRVSK